MPLRLRVDAELSNNPWQLNCCDECLVTTRCRQTPRKRGKYTISINTLFRTCSFKRPWLKWVGPLRLRFDRLIFSPEGLLGLSNFTGDLPLWWMFLWAPPKLRIARWLRRVRCWLVRWVVDVIASKYEPLLRWGSWWGLCNGLMRDSWSELVCVEEGMLRSKASMLSTLRVGWLWWGESWSAVKCLLLDC